jgi:hypothetical protein
LPTVLAIPGHEGGLFELTEEARQHWLKVFALIFGREAFLPTPSDSRTFHQRALEEGRFYEERVATNLSNLVFGQVFPRLTRAIAAAAPEAPLQEVPWSLGRSTDGKLQGEGRGAGEEQGARGLSARALKPLDPAERLLELKICDPRDGVRLLPCQSG